jgi:hypothetical protein
MLVWCVGGRGWVGVGVLWVSCCLLCLLAGVCVCVLVCLREWLSVWVWISRVGVLLLSFFSFLEWEYMCYVSLSRTYYFLFSDVI